MAGYGNLFETDTESLLNEMNTAAVYNNTTQQANIINSSINSQMNNGNSPYSTQQHPHQQMQQQQGK